MANKSDKSDTLKKEELEKTTKNKVLMLETLIKSMGVVTTACKSCGISASQFYKWCTDDPTFKEEVDAVKDIALDFVESKLFGKIQDGDVTCILFYLKTQGKKRGYIERIQTEDIGKPTAVQVKIIRGDEDTDTSDD